MQTPIGQAIRSSRRGLAIAALTGAAIICSDLGLTWYRQYMTPFRLGFLVVAIVVYGRLAQWDSGSLGLSLRPVQGWGYWVVATLLIGAGMLVFLAAAALVYRLHGASLDLYQRPPAEILPWFYYACISAPVLEEIIYRFVLCVPAAGLVRPWGAIALSGVIFGLLHVVAGVASPDNLIAGFILAWAYLKSGSLFIPITLHALGNTCILIAQVAAWYWQG